MPLRGVRKLGRIIQRYKIEKGEYVPDDVVIQAVKARTGEPDCAAGFLLDGFPRTIPQAESLETMLAAQERKLNCVLDFEAPIADIVGRFSGRRVCPRDGSTYHIESQPPLIAGLCDLCGTPLERRPDDDPDVVQRRLEVYAEKNRALSNLLSRTQHAVHYRCGRRAGNRLQRGCRHSEQAGEVGIQVFRVFRCSGKCKSTMFAGARQGVQFGS